MADPPATGLIKSASFRLDPDAPRQVRAFLSEAARLDSIRAAEAALLATELVSNALKHARVDEVEVSVERRDPAVRITVSHQAESPLGEVERGFGLTLVEAVGRSWGHAYEDGRLRVWFEVRSPGVARVPLDLSDGELVARISDDPMYAEALVERHRELALSIARRYRGKGISLSDLEQVAMMALVRAVHRFDPARGDLESYAAVTISGEMKRALRDRAWSVRIPRTLQERALEVGKAAQGMTQALGRAPRLSELAEALDLTEEEVAEALSARHAFSASSLDAPDETTGLPALDRLAEIDDQLAEVEHRGVVLDALERLPERQRLIVLLRFYRGMTQTEIAEVVGISQMHVSRLLARSLAELREILADPSVVI